MGKSLGWDPASGRTSGILVPNSTASTSALLTSWLRYSGTTASGTACNAARTSGFLSPPNPVVFVYSPCDIEGSGMAGYEAVLIGSSAPESGTRSLFILVPNSAAGGSSGFCFSVEATWFGRGDWMTGLVIWLPGTGLV